MCWRWIGMFLCVSLTFTPFDSFSSKIKVQYGVCSPREIQYNYPESSAGWFNAPSSHITPDYWWDIQTAAERRQDRCDISPHMFHVFVVFKFQRRSPVLHFHVNSFRLLFVFSFSCRISVYSFFFIMPYRWCK